MKAAEIELNPALHDRGADFPVAISTRRRGDSRSTRESGTDWQSTRECGCRLAIERSKTATGRLQPVAVFAVDGAPSTTRTCDLLDRNQTLYPTELWARFKSGAGAYRIADVSEYLAVRAVDREPVSLAEILGSTGKIQGIRPKPASGWARFSNPAPSTGSPRRVSLNSETGKFLPTSRESRDANSKSCS